MRSLLSKITALAVAIFMMLSFVAVQPAEAQTYPPLLPPSPSGTEVLAVIQANAAADAAESAAAAGDAAAAQAQADIAAALLATAKSTQSDPGILAQLEAASLRATAAAARAAGPASVPAAVAVPVPSLAFTGSDVNLPLAAGALLVGAGGLTLLAARKREQNA